MLLNLIRRFNFRANIRLLSVYTFTRNLQLDNKYIFGRFDQEKSQIILCEFDMTAIAKKVIAIDWDKCAGNDTIKKVNCQLGILVFKSLNKALLCVAKSVESLGKLTSFKDFFIRYVFLGLLVSTFAWLSMRILRHGNSEVIIRV